VDEAMSLAGEGSHIPLLASVVAIARPGPVLELGVGDSSTPLLREMCRAMGREHFRLDTSPEWCERYDAIPLSIGLPIFAHEWAVVFVDTSPPPNRLELVRLARSEFIVVHDTDNQSGDLTELVECLQTFPHCFTYDAFRPWTTVVSRTRSYP
jgi:hypothetical protein